MSRRFQEDKQENALARFQVDDVIQAKVINVSREDKKIGLSVRKLEESSEKDSYRSYLNNQKEATSNLGQILSEKMMNQERQTLAADRGRDEDDEASEKEES